MSIVCPRTFSQLQHVRNLFWTQHNLEPNQRLKSEYAVSKYISKHWKALHNIFLEGNIDMKKKAKKFVWKGYANIGISEHDMEDAQIFIANEKKIWTLFNQTLLDGYRINFNSDHEKEHFKCTMTCYTEEDSNFGMAMSAYGGDWITALGALLYKHTVVASGDWTDYVQSDKKSFG